MVELTRPQLVSGTTAIGAILPYRGRPGTAALGRFRLLQDTLTRQPLDHPVRGDENLALVTGALCVDQRLSDRLYRIDSVNGS